MSYRIMYSSFSLNKVTRRTEATTHVNYEDAFLLTIYKFKNVIHWQNFSFIFKKNVQKRQMYGTTKEEEEERRKKNVWMGRDLCWSVIFLCENSKELSSNDALVNWNVFFFIMCTHENCVWGGANGFKLGIYITNSGETNVRKLFYFAAFGVFYGWGSTEIVPLRLRVIDSI